MYTQNLKRLMAELDTLLSAVDEAELRQFQDAILAAKRIFIAGKGRSGLAMRAFAMRLMHLGLSVHVVDDVTTPALTSADLLIIGSGSGRTPALLQYAARATDIGAALALITTNPDSAIARQAQHTLLLKAPTPKLGADSVGESILPMGSIFEQGMGLLLDLMVLELMQRLGTDSDTMFTRHANLE